MINRGRLDRATQEEFEHLITRLRGYLSQSFDEDGALIVADPNLAVMPVGGIVPFAGATAPSGYLLCDGAQVNRVTYKSLFDVIGTTYGAGDGSTTFNLPDLRQRFPLGKAAAGTGSTLGATGGAIDHTHTVPDHTHSTPAHSHTVTGAASTNGSHAHTVDAHTHSVTVSGTTGAPSAVLDAMARNDAIYSVFVQPSTGDHTHTVSASGTTGSASPATDSAGDHTHSITGNTATDGGGTTGSAGAGTTGSSNAPYTVVNYLIFAGV